MRCVWRGQQAVRTLIDMLGRATPRRSAPCAGGPDRLRRREHVCQAPSWHQSFHRGVVGPATRRWLLKIFTTAHHGWANHRHFDRFLVAVTFTADRCAIYVKSRRRRHSTRRSTARPSRIGGLPETGISISCEKPSLRP